MEVLTGLKDLTTDSLLDMFQEGGKADYITWYMRALTAGNSLFPVATKRSTSRNVPSM